MCCYLCGNQGTVEIKTTRGDIAYVCESCDEKLNSSEEQNKE